MDKIRLTSKALRYSFLFLAALSLIAPFFVHFSNDPVSELWRAKASAIVESPLPLSIASRLWLGASLLPSAILFAFALFFSGKILKHFEKGQYISLDIACLLKRAAMLFLCSEVVSIFQGGLYAYLLTMKNPVGEKFLAFSVSTQNVSYFIFSLIMMLASWIMQQSLSAKK